MPAALSAVRSALAARLTAAGIRAYASVPDKPEPPCGVVQMPETIDFDTTMGRGSDVITIGVLMLAARATDTYPQALIDGWLAGSGSGSVKTIVEGTDPTLGGVAQTIRVTQARNVGFAEVGETTYLGAQFMVEVVT